MGAAFYMNRIRQYETHQSYPHRQIVSVHGRSPDLELHAYSACLPGFPVTLPRFVALTVEWAVPDFHRIPFSCTFVQPWPVWFFCVSKFYMLLLKCQCLFPVFSSVSIILFPIFPGYVFFGFFGSFLPAFSVSEIFRLLPYCQYRRKGCRLECRWTFAPLFEKKAPNWILS